MSAPLKLEPGLLPTGERPPANELWGYWWTKGMGGPPYPRIFSLAYPWANDPARITCVLLARMPEGTTLW